MIRKYLTRLRERVRSFWELEDPEERIEGSGEAYLDPAYNGRYTFERRLKRQSELADRIEEGELDEQDLHGDHGDALEQVHEGGRRR